MKESAKESKAGFFSLIVLGLMKFGGKLLPFFLQLGKALKVGKVALAFGSFATYTYLFSWKFALVLMGSLFIHELGHVWAMKRYGVPHRGINFIPLLGAVIVPERDFPTREAEGIIGIMGPVFGAVLALIIGGMYVVLGWPILAAIAGWIAFVNVFNLIPVLPLDGGRVVRSVAHSLHSAAGITFHVVSFVIGFYLVVHFKLGLLAPVIGLGFFESLIEVARARRAASGGASERLIRLGLAMDRVGAPLKFDPTGGEDECYYTFEEGVSDSLRHETEIVSAANEALPFSFLDRPIFLRGPERRDGEGVFGSPRRFKMTGDILRFANEEHERVLSDRQEKPRMSGKRSVLLFGSYAILAAALVVLMAYMSRVPDAKVAFDVLRQ